jgi:hypothetical protein
MTHTLTAINNRTLLAQVHKIEGSIGSLEIGWGKDASADAWWIRDGADSRTGLNFADVVEAIQKRIDRRVEALQFEAEENV